MKHAEVFARKGGKMDTMKELLGDLWFALKVTIVAFINGKKALQMVQEHPVRES